MKSVMIDDKTIVIVTLMTLASVVFHISDVLHNRKLWYNLKSIIQTHPFD